jgi:hypothetical protein
MTLLGDRSELIRLRNQLARVIRLPAAVAALDAQIAEQAATLAAIRGDIQALEQTPNRAASRRPESDRGHHQAIQHLLRLQYRALIDNGLPLPAFGDSEFRLYSQNGEDGIIQLILAAVGTSSLRSVEICAGDGIECNSANLIINHGWHGLLIDGHEKILDVGGAFYGACLDTWVSPPEIRHAWVTVDNVNDLVTEAGFSGEIDLLSIDMDGMDYWIWEALGCISPRIVVAEYNSLWRNGEAFTIPYDSGFAWEPGSAYVGASLGAMCKLAARKGYRLVGAQRYAFNAFFARDDLAREILPAVPQASCLAQPRNEGDIRLGEEALSRSWIEV